MAIVDPKRGVVARYMVTTEVRGKKALIGMQADGTTAEIMLIADQTAIINPVNGQLVTAFVVSGGRVVIRDALIASLGIEKLRALDGSLAFENGRLRADLIDAQRLRLKFGQIDDVWIQNAQIGTAAVDTFKLAGHAVTVATTFSTSNHLDHPIGQWWSVGAFSHNAEGGGTALSFSIDAEAEGRSSFNDPAGCGFAVRVLVDGTTRRNFGFVRYASAPNFSRTQDCWSNVLHLGSWSGERWIDMQVQFNGSVRRTTGCSAIAQSSKR